MKPTIKLQGRFIEKGFEEDGIAWISHGDCTHIHINCFRKGIIDLYGDEAVGPIQKDEKDVFYFLYDESVDTSAIDKHIGVRISGPSVSSTSSTSYHQGTKPWYAKFQKRKRN